MESRAHPAEMFRLVERNGQPFEYSDKKASLGKMYLGED